MKIIKEQTFLKLWHSYGLHACAALNKDILSFCSGVKTLSAVKRNNVTFSSGSTGETYTWLFKGHNGESEIIKTFAMNVEK